MMKNKWLKKNDKRRKIKIESKNDPDNIKFMHTLNECKIKDCTMWWQSVFMIEIINKDFLKFKIKNNYIQDI